MKTSVNIFVYLSLITLLVSCAKCDKTLSCLGLPEEYRQLVDYEKGDSIVFVNQNAQRIVFYVSSAKYSPPVSASCPTDRMGGCSCPFKKCSNSSFVYSNSKDSSRYYIDTTRDDTLYLRNFNLFVSLGDEPYFNIGVSTEIPVQFYVYGVGGNYMVSPFTTTRPEQEYVESVTIGPKTYGPVIIHHVDTTKTIPEGERIRKYFVSEIYISREEGVVAFYDITTQSLFYLE